MHGSLRKQLCLSLSNLNVITYGLFLMSGLSPLTLQNFIFPSQLSQLTGRQTDMASARPSVLIVPPLTVEFLGTGGDITSTPRALGGPQLTVLQSFKQWKSPDMDRHGQTWRRMALGSAMQKSALWLRRSPLHGSASE